jgi:probable phosphoglycerate mutase
MSALRQELWLIRHGETEWSAAKRHTGRTDIPLTPTGERQAAALSRSLAGRKFASVLCASMTDDLVEWDYGVYEGKTTQQIRLEQPGWSIWTSAVVNGESTEQVGRRAQRVIQRTLAANGDVVLFAHAHILRILTACWLGLAPDAGRLFVLCTASISVRGFEHDTPVITRWNLSNEESI